MGFSMDKKGKHTLSTGQQMACVFMSKRLAKD
jgi:hypothetical protein